MTERLKKLAVTPELAEAFRLYSALKRASRTTLRDTISAAMDAAAEQEEKLNRMMDSWWQDASKVYNTNFSNATYVIDYLENQLWIIPLEAGGQEKVNLNS
ncbi:MAG: hypothetical protein ACYC1K_03410 [Minisyncoccota bacterium]